MNSSNTKANYILIQLCNKLKKQEIIKQTSKKKLKIYRSGKILDMVLIKMKVLCAIISKKDSVLGEIWYEKFKELEVCQVAEKFGQLLHDIKTLTNEIK